MLNVTLRWHDKVAILRVEGRVDSNNYPQFKAKVDEVAETAECQYLVLEMDATEHLSSAGMRVLIAAQRLFVHTKGGKVLLAQPSTEVVEIVSMLGLGSNFILFPSTEAALESLV